MSEKSVVEQIKHYQKDIDRCPQNSDRMIRCIQRLCLIPVTVQHLQVTGIGRSVNSLRKYGGEVAEAAKALVAKWKAMVAAEESSEEEVSGGSDLSSSNKIKYNTVSNESKSESSIVLEIEKQNVISSKSNLKPKESNEYRSKTYTSSDSCSKKYGHHSKNKVEEKLSSSHKTSSEYTKLNAKEYTKNHQKIKNADKYKELELKRQQKLEYSPKEISDRHSKDKSRHSSTSRRDKTKNHDLRDDDRKISSPVRKKRKKSAEYEPTNFKNKRDLKEESCDESEENSGSEEFDNSEQQSLNSEDDLSRQSPEKSDSGNENSDQSSDSNSVYNNNSKDQTNGHSSQTSESESESDSSSNNSDNTYSNKRKHSVDGRDKYRNVKIKTEEDHKKSSLDKNLTLKIKQEKCDRVVIKKEKDIQSKSKSDKKSKEYEQKSISVQSVKSSKSKSSTTKENSRNTIKIEKAEDGSIDCESGASFADALLGMSGSFKKSQKKKSSTSSSKSLSNSKSSTKSKGFDSGESAEPVLLTKNIKLEPLEVDLAATLPEITPNYRPLPRYSPPSSPVNKRSKLMSQEEALSSIMSTKNLRTKVFSGNRSTVLSTVPSLFDFCIQVLRENIEALEYTGGVPYDVLKPVLDRATADQLYRLEHYNPYLIEDTDSLWAFHCNKDFRGKKREDLESWRDLYLRCLDEREQKLKALTANISQSMAKSTPVRQTKLAYVDSVVKPPRNIARKQAKFGTANTTKHDIVAKAVVGAHSSSSGQPLANDVVPPPSRSSSTASTPFVQNFLKKKKAPLMAKALQLIKGNRFKR